MFRLRFMLSTESTTGSILKSAEMFYELAMKPVPKKCFYVERWGILKFVTPKSLELEMTRIGQNLQ